MPVQGGDPLTATHHSLLVKTAPVQRSPSVPSDPGRAEDAALVVEADALGAKQAPLLVEGDALVVARPLALEAAEGHAGGDDAVTGHRGGEGVAAKGVADGAGRRAQVCG